MKRILLTIFMAGAVLAAKPGTEAVPLFFVANHGQSPSPVQFTARGSGVEAWFAPGGVVLRVAGASVRIEAAGANPFARIEGSGPMPGKANFLIGSEDAWRLDVPLYGSIVYRALYPGIDMTYGSEGRSLKSEFVVAPGANPANIRIRYLGVGQLRLDDSGALLIPVAGHELREEAPVIYQNRDGARLEVGGRFAVAADGSVGFLIDPYDPFLPLIIDPTLSYSTLLGGANSEAANALAVDSTGAVYVTGFTASRDFPTANPVQNFNAGSNDVFVAKLNPTGNGLVYCTYLGGSGDDRAFGIAVDSNGSAVVTGSTTSANFPTRGAIQAKLAGPKNAFIVKLSPAGNSLVFSTYLGGSASDIANGIALDSGGNAYITGDTTSMNFPASGLQQTKRGSQDAFVAKIGADGARLVYSTYLGGISDDHGAAIAVDAAGEAYVAGSTYSIDFPVMNPWQPSLKGGQDAFVAKLSADGHSLLFSTYLGGSSGLLGYPETAQGIALDSQGNAYLAGVTGSADFPLLNPLQTSRMGSLDAFIAKVSPAGVLLYSTYLGGTGIDVGNAVGVDSIGSAYVVGYTFSNDLPVIGGALQNSPAGDYDAFVARVSPAGDSLWYLSYLGGNGSDTATAVATDPAGNVYVAGYTLSTNFPVLGAFQSTNAGTYGAFIAKMVFNPPPANVGVTPSSGSGLSQTFAFQASDVNGGANLTTVSVLFQPSVSLANACAVTYNRASNTLFLLTDTGAAPSGSIAPGSGSQQNTQCTLSGTGSSVSVAGTVLTLNLSITFQTAFNGSRNIYMQAADAFASNTWQQVGSWTVPANSLAIVSVTPASGTGTSQTFTFLFSDTRGYTAIGSAQIIVNSPLSVANGCYLYFSRAANGIYLTNNAGTAWQGPVTIGQSATLQNSECTVSAAGSSSSGAGSNLTLNLALTFLPAFVGNKNVYVEAYDGTLDTGWVQKGSWTVTATALAIVSVTPNSGTGGSQSFAFLYSDTKGYATISSAQVIINNPLTANHACYLFFNRAASLIYLTNDAGTAWQTPITLGQNTTLQNSQCTVSGAATSASGNGNSLTLNLALTFTSAFKGTRNIYAEVYDGTADSGWLQMGSWIIP